MSHALYNEIEPFACDWLEQLIAAGHIAPGRVERRSIAELTPDDVAGRRQRHFFAGIGGWSAALRHLLPIPFSPLEIRSERGVPPCVEERRLP